MNRFGHMLSISLMAGLCLATTSHAGDNHTRWIDEPSDNASKPAGKIALGVLCMLGGTVLTLVGVTVNAIPDQKCEQGPSGFTTCTATDNGGSGGTLAILSGLALIGGGIYEIAGASKSGN